MLKELELIARLNYTIDATTSEIDACE